MAEADSNVSATALKALAVLDLIGEQRRPLSVAIGRLRNNIIKSSWRFWVRLEQLRVRANVARGKNPQLLPRRTVADKLQFD